MTARALPRRPPLTTAIWLVVAVTGWAMIAWLGARLFATQPPSAGFDLELLLQAGRDVAAGRTPYDPALLGGDAPQATGLFFSYPPLVGQAFALVAAVPSGVVFLVWSVGAVAALLAVGDRLRQAIGATPPRGVTTLALLAIASLTFPFTIAVLFGNVDAFFPALYGLVLVAAISVRRGDHVAGGIALAIAAATKLYPAGLGLWFAVRALRDRGAATVVGAAAVTGLALLAASLVAGGLDPWRDYATVLGAASRAELLDPANVSPAALLTRLIGRDSDGARLVQLLIAAAAVTVIAWAAWRRSDPVEGLAIAATATFVLLPVTWVHYPAALIPFGAAAVLRSRGPAAQRTRLLLAGSILVAGASLAWLPLLWLAVGLVIAAVHASAAETEAEL